MVSQAQLEKFFSKKNILVTGGLGSIGSEIVRGLLKYELNSLRVVDNRETELFYASKKNTDPRLDYYFGDIRDKESLRPLLRNVDVVFHAAAMKHVIVCEKHPSEAIKTNIQGTQNIIDLSIEYGIEKVIHISTDKAVNPEGVMGTTKLLAEKMISAMHSARLGHKTKFGAVRFGNVMYSRGSVLEIWDAQIRQDRPISITDPRMTRFLMSIPQSVELIFASAFLIQNAEIFIMKMPSCSIQILADAYLKINRKTPGSFEVIGINRGDKFHEKLFSDDERAFLLENKNFFIKLPLELDKLSNIDRQYYYDLGFQETQNQNFSSDNEEYLMDPQQAEEILGGFILKTD
jgi:FlaA1/EpsC-like NDP-sugar epimerase